MKKTKSSKKIVLKITMSMTVLRCPGGKDVDNAREGEDQGWRVLSFDVVVEANDLSL